LCARATRASPSCAAVPVCHPRRAGRRVCFPDDVQPSPYFRAGEACEFAIRHTRRTYKAREIKPVKPSN
jgi:hypothetical protein